uniref:Myeloid-derived growth factor-like n=1 Tax=Sinocyclocheilus grahami TaxID=75366 RepID=A0A672RTL3_SINGR
MTVISWWPCSLRKCLKQALNGLSFLSEDLFVIQPTPLGFSVNVFILSFSSSQSQTAVGGQRDVALKEEEYSVSESSVTHREGTFHSELSKLTVIGRTRHDEL